MKKFYIAALVLITCAAAVLVYKPKAAKPAAVLQDTGILNNLPAIPGMAKAGTNPAHGQPNHRCDIPVGASLTTSVNATQAVNASQVNPVMQAPVIQTQSNNDLKKNPAHGEPNHRCDIPVGASLDTPVKTPPAVNAAEVTPAPQVPVAQAQTTGIPTKNPAHGLPYHKCELAVGADL